MERQENFLAEFNENSVLPAESWGRQGNVYIKLDGAAFNQQDIELIQRYKYVPFHVFDDGIVFAQMDRLH